MKVKEIVDWINNNNVKCSDFSKLSGIRENMLVNLTNLDRELDVSTWMKNSFLNGVEKYEKKSTDYSIQANKEKLFHSVANAVAEKLAKKNADYGDSFFDVYSKFGDVSSYIRLLDKMGRLESAVSGKELKVADETLEDIYWDIAGYAILTIASKIRLQNKEEVDEYEEDEDSIRKNKLYQFVKENAATNMSNEDFLDEIVDIVSR